MSSELHRPDRRSLAWAILGAIAVALCISRSFAISPTVPRLDPSFIYAFNHAATRTLAWGHDFVSTYGPYGYVLATVDIAGLAVRKLVFSLLLVAGVGAAVATYVWRKDTLPAAVRLTLMAALLYALEIQSMEYQCFAFLVLVLLIGLRSRERISVVLFGLAGGLAGLYVLVKFSLGLGAVLAVAVACLLDRRPLLMACRSGLALGCGIGSILLGWSAYRGGLSGIGDYLASGLDVSGGYSSAMSFAQEPVWVGPASFLMWFVGVGLWVVRERSPRLLLSLGTLAVPLFVAWKHSVVRQDGHVMTLILFGVFALTILLIDASVLGRFQRSVPTLAVLLVPLLIPWYSLPLEHRAEAEAAELCQAQTLEARLVQPFGLCGARQLWTLRHFGEYRDRLAQMSREALRPDALAEATRSRIGTASVDVYPWEIAYVPANGLSWSNRPMPASFNAYTPKLDALNAEFFTSDRRPEYLLWHTGPRGDGPLGSIDGRHLFWDEPDTLRAILSTYDLVESSPGIHVLKARSRPRLLSTRSIGRATVAWETWLQVPEAPGIVLVHGTIEPSLIMRAVRAGFRESAIYMSLRFSSGEEARYRIVPANAGQGLWLTPFPNTVDEFVELLRTGSGRRVVAVRFSMGRLRRFYAPVEVSWSQVVLADARWTGPPP